MGEARIMGRRGDDRFTWDPANLEEVAVVRAKVDAAIKAGAMAFRATPDGSPGERIRAFNPEYERIVIVPALAGGI